MKNLFLSTAQECSQLITKRYSTSFTLGIQTLSKKYHTAIYSIYAYVRYADEIVDTFHDQNKALLLEEFKNNTYTALERKVSLNPVLHAFQDVVRNYNIDIKLIDAFLYSMEMDLTDTTHQSDSYNEYIYGSAEVVGLMCLKVFCKDQPEEYERLAPPARSLGAAFQKVNFLRDIKSDFEERGRVYFPNVDFSSFNNDQKQAIEADIAKDFAHALEGIRQLPQEARSGVYLAYIYYLQLFKKISDMPCTSILSKRIRIPDFQKIILLSKTLIMHKLNIIH